MICFLKAKNTDQYLVTCNYLLVTISMFKSIVNPFPIRHLIIGSERGC